MENDNTDYKEIGNSNILTDNSDKITFFCNECLVILNKTDYNNHLCEFNEADRKYYSDFTKKSKNKYFLRSLCGNIKKQVDIFFKNKETIQSLEKKLKEYEKKLIIIEEQTRSNILAQFVSKAYGIGVDELIYSISNSAKQNNNKKEKNESKNQNITPNVLSNNQNVLNSQNIPVFTLQEKEKKKDYFRTINPKNISHNDDFEDSHDKDNKDNKDTPEENKDNKDNKDKEESVLVLHDRESKRQEDKLKNRIEKTKIFEEYKKEYSTKQTNLLNKLRESKERNNVEKEFIELTKLRKEYFGLITYNNFVTFLNKEYHDVIKMCSDKNFLSKTTDSIINTCYTQIERKIIYKDKSSNKEVLDNKTLEFYRNNLFYVNEKLSYYLRENIIVQFFTYDICLQSFEQIFKTVVNLNKNLIVYIPHKKSNKNDPYTFYTRTKNENKNDKSIETKRNWVLDGRLEYFTTCVRDELSSYCIIMFRNIYFSIYNDNDFRKDFLKKEYNGTQELKQLLQNFKLISNFYNLNKTLKNIIMKESTIEINENDRVNLQSDCPIQKEKFSTMNEGMYKNDVFENVRELFENFKESDKSLIYDTIMSS